MVMMILLGRSELRVLWRARHPDMDVRSRCGVRRSSTARLPGVQGTVLYEGTGSDVRTVNGGFVLPRDRGFFGICIAKISYIAEETR